jgi:hypothetical protein
MKSMSTKQLAAVVIAALAVTGGGAAVAAASGGKTATSTAATAFRGGPGDELSTAASYLGTTVAGLQTQLQSGKTLAQIASATSGKSTDGLIAALVAAEQKEHPNAPASEITQRVTDFVNGVLPPHGPGFGHGPGGFDLSAAASYLGLTVSQLQADLQSGQTLAQVANATGGKSAAGLIQALVAADTTRITALVNGTAPTS